MLLDQNLSVKRTERQVVIPSWLPQNDWTELRI